MKTTHVLAALLASVSLSVQAQQMPYQNKALTPEQRAEDLLQRLTLPEKLGLMENASQPVERLGIKPYNWWNETLHGVGRNGLATVFPQCIGLAATFDNDLVYQVFDAASDEARAKHYKASQEGDYDIYKGLTFWTPNINIFRDPRWGRGQETYGEDPYLTSLMGLAVVRGLQGTPRDGVDKLHACAKHFAVHSGPEWNRHSFDIQNLDPRDLWETYLPAFKVLVEQGHVKEVMCAYNRVDGEPCCGNSRLLNQILRNEWGFDGVLTSDCGAVSDFFVKGRHETHPDAASASAAAVLSGTDIECGHVYTNNLGEAIEKGLIDEQAINVSVKRLLKARFELGEMDATSPWDDIPYSVVSSAKHQQINLKAALESIVLLQNKNNILPLNPRQTVAVIGANANDSIMLWGNYNGFPDHTTTALEGIQQYARKVIYDKGCELVAPEGEAQTIDPKRLLKKIAKADVVIYVGGISPNLEGEEMPVTVKGFRGGDRTDIQLPAIQRQLLADLKKAGKKVVFVNCSGSAMGLAPETENCEAIVQWFYGGQQGGKALAQVLYGEYNPSGRLPVTFYKDTLQISDFQEYSMKGRTYRYMKQQPTFCFGHGLSYTTFNYGEAKVTRDRMVIPVTNTGKRDGDEVVQLYVSRPSDAEGPVKTLRGFKRVHIPVGQTVEVEFPLNDDTFCWWDTWSNTMIALSGEYQLQYGGTSDSQGLKSVKVVRP